MPISGLHGAHDADRDVTVVFATGISDVPWGEGWLLHAHGEFLPFDLLIEVNTVDGVGLRAISFRSLGGSGSGSVTLLTGVRGRTMTSASEERELAMLIIEGVLVAQKKPFGGYWVPPVFAALGREWRLTDFGYTEEADRDDA
jgi:hypothetical protein